MCFNTRPQPCGDLVTVLPPDPTETMTDLFELVQQYPVLLAFGIFFARVCDVSLGTLRTIIVFRGHRLLAASIGFVEATIFILAVSQVIKNLDAWYLAIAYAGGFACGNYLGMVVESKLAMGKELLRVVSYRADIELADLLRRHGAPVIEMDGRRRNREPVTVLLVILPRKRVPEILAVVKAADPDAMFTITDVKQSVEDDLELTTVPISRSGWRVRGKQK